MTFQILLGIAAVSGLAALLALLLEVADAFFADYGQCRIDINEGAKELDVLGGGRLLPTLMDEGIFVPSACGGRGSCGLCKVTVESGGGPVLPTETPYLNPDELKQGVRLSCQVKVRNDLSIRMDPALFSIRRFQARVASLTDLTPVIKEVRLEFSDPRTMDFLPGQFIQFEAPAYKGSPEPVYRAYSIASSAEKNTGITLCITRVPEGLATTYVHDHLKPGDEVSINGPYGDFYLRDTEAEMIMIATGSGLAPLLSILYQMAGQGSQRKATLFFGTRTKKELFYLDVIKDFENKLPNFTFVPVLSAPEPEDQWEGETGIVTHPIEKYLESGQVGEAYLCGHPLMIDAAVKMFTAHGLAEEKIYYDKFA